MNSVACATTSLTHAYGKVCRTNPRRKIHSNYPSLKATENEKAFDIGKLRDQTGYVTLDSGYKNTGATKSAITFLDGEEGILRYRGYPIEQLAEKSNFLEVAYLLIYGALPTQSRIDDFAHQITKHTLVHEDLRKIFDGYPVGRPTPWASFAQPGLLAHCLLSRRPQAQSEPRGNQP